MNALQPRPRPARAAGPAVGGCWAAGRPPYPPLACPSSAAREALWDEPRAVAAPHGSSGALLCRGGQPVLEQGSPLLPATLGARGGAFGRARRDRPGTGGRGAAPGRCVPAGREWSLSSEGRREAPGGCPCYETGAFVCDLINQG